MAWLVVCLAVLLVVAYRATTPAERVRYGRAALHYGKLLKDMAVRARLERDPFHDALCLRTPRVFVTPAIIAINATIFLCLAFAPGSVSDPETLVDWGASLGPRTTNGEWWRLVTAMFVHAGFFSLLLNIAGLVQIGLLLERAVGHLSVAVVYLTAGVLASLASLAAHPLVVTAGASGAVFGIYGLLLPFLVRSLIRRSTVTIPLMTLRRLAPLAVVFVLYTAAMGGLPGAAETTGFIVGVIAGVALPVGSDRNPALRRVAAATAVASVMIVAFAFPLRGLADVRPELARIVELEDRTAGAYQNEVGRFRKNRIDAGALLQLIDATIVPELQAARARLIGIENVPVEHQPLIASAAEYFRLREHSWRLRADGLRETNMRKLQEAGAAEQAAIEALQKIRR